MGDPRSTARRHGDADQVASGPRVVEGVRSDEIPVEIVAIGSSTGGPGALCELLGCLPKSLGVPVVVAQHMPPQFTHSMAENLDRDCALSVREARDGDPLTAGSVLVAPGGKSTVVDTEGARRVLRVFEADASAPFRPSVGQLFDSVADVFGGRAVATVLTGMGDDGADAALRLRGLGAMVLAQDESSSVVYGMPRAVVERGAADRVGAPRDLADQIVCTVLRRNGGCRR